ncbi:tachykinin-like peptides receptor 99D [Argopecten irradians]|uniref:tachykinin-like peptides receptor 99D n=1 Tax=Argopecten irradians TaxID=31199 RepID=UPI00371929FF
MSIADTGVGLFVTTTIVITILKIPIPTGWCYFSPYFELTTLSAGIFSSLLISYDRHLAVSKALSYRPTKRGAVTSLMIVWLSAFVYSLRIFLQNEVANILKSKAVISSDDDANSTITDTEDDDDGENEFCNVLVEEDFNDLIFRCIDFVVLFIIPIACMVYWYKGIIQKLWAVNVAATSNLQKKRRVIKLLIANIVVFFVCWIPFYLSDIINDSIAVVISTADENFEEAGSLQVIRMCLIFIAVSHSYLHPIIFLSFHSDIKAEVMSTVLCAFCFTRRVGDEKNVSAITEQRTQTIS